MSKDEIRSMSYIKFAEDNEYKYFQDMRWWQNAPSDVMFYPVSDNPNSIVFIGDGYGIQEKHCLPGKYGNGAIFIYKDSIPHLLEWCRNNMLHSVQKDKRSVARDGE